MGLGALITFMAFILIAAVAAGTLIKSSGTLEYKARTTGEMTVKEVSTNLKIIEIAGFTGDGQTLQGNITKIIITVALAPGSSDIGLGDIVMNYQGPNNYIRGIRYNSTLGASENSTTNDNDVADFGVTYLSGSDDNNLKRNDIIELHYWVEDDAGDRPISPNQEFCVTLIPVGANPLDYCRITPRTITTLYVRKFFS